MSGQPILSSLDNVVEDTTPQLGGTLDSNAHQVNWSKGSDVASAGALTLGTDGNYFDITGTTTITSIATLGIGTVVVLHFDGALTLTHHAADLTLPGGANITTAAGDEAMFVEYATGDWRCVSYTKADGTAVAGGGATLITKSIADIATDINGFSLAAVPAGMMNAWAASLNASIFNEAGLTVANSALIFNEAGLTAANSALIFNEAGLTVANSALIFNEAGLTAANSALIFNEAGLTAANSALIFNEAGFTVANKASVCNEATFTFANKALMFREAGLSIANINAIIIHANITDDNAQQILSEITKANRDLTSAANIYEILDDWDDNKLTGRDGAGATPTGFTNMFAQKNLFRPAYTQTGTAFTVSGGVLHQVITADGDCLLASSDFVTGTWDVKYTRINVADGWSLFVAFGPDYSNNYSVWIQQSVNTLWLTKIVVEAQTAIIQSTWSNDGNPHTFKLTRDVSGNFELFEDGNSKGTVTDTTHTTSSIIGFRDDNAAVGTQADWDDLRVY